jgi:hypothetical protein
MGKKRTIKQIIKQIEFELLYLRGSFCASCIDLMPCKSCRKQGNSLVKELKKLKKG